VNVPAVSTGNTGRSDSIVEPHEQGRCGLSRSVSAEERREKNKERGVVGQRKEVKVLMPRGRVGRQEALAFSTAGFSRRGLARFQDLDKQPEIPNGPFTAGCGSSFCGGACEGLAKLRQRGGRLQGWCRKRGGQAPLTFRFETTTAECRPGSSCYSFRPPADFVIFVIFDDLLWPEASRSPRWM